VSHWLAHFFGFSAGDGNGSPYLFWSGTGGLAERALELLAIGWLFLWRTSCHDRRWCLRHGRHAVTDPETGVTHKVCWKHAHLPSKYGHGRIRAIQAKHKILYLGDKPGRG
jgi:hypothetical protein